MEYIGAILEERFDYKGFPCVVLMQAGCFRTGYVGLDKNNRYYGKDYIDIPVVCHGGLTYASDYLYSQDDDGMWWIGFDTAHYGDGKDYTKAMELFNGYPKVINQIKETRRLDLMYGLTYSENIASLKYCKRECMDIVEQLLECGE